MNTLLAKSTSVVFGGTLTFSSVLSVNLKENGQISAESADSTRTVNRVYVDRKTAIVTVVTSDQSSAADAKARVGTKGALTFGGLRRSDGSSMGTETLTATIADAILIDTDIQFPSEGVGQATYTFQAFDVDGDGNYLTYAYA